MTLEARIKSIIGEQAFTIAAQQQQISELLEKIAEAKTSQAKALARIDELKAASVPGDPADQGNQAADAP